ncbi:MAG TPA: OmpA family protein [Puia sp.]|jgi:outer membrane protein OmpA-like peptidoglycan-associated protein
MRRFLFLSLFTVALTSYGQKPSIIGFSANLVDFSASVPKVGKADPGFSIMYWKGITRKIDFSLRYNGLFSDYSKNQDGASQYINEFEASLHARPINDDHLLSPFLSAGIGIGNYGNRWAPYTPLGGGLQLNMKGEGYIFLQMNYRVSLKSESLDNNVFYSIGFTSPIGSPREEKPVIKALPPPPVVEVKDRDNDGVADSLDACPDVAGLAQFNGCPDTDGDGIPDKEDKCPNQKGLAKYNGCPIPDTDGDGINDEEDKCPLVRGTAKYQGCPIPDRDGDGVNDEEDKCPDLAGSIDNQGCPIVKEEVRKKADLAAHHIYFATARFTLLKKSFIGLDEIVALMKQDAGLQLSVDGYTDNTGLAEKNRVLSENRAASVKKYLVAKGVEDGRIRSAGHGPSDPIADNKTPAGRAKNRRVELRLDYR